MSDQQTAAEPKWSREDLQRVLLHVCKQYEADVAFQGGFSELMNSAIYDLAIPTLKDNHWWPDA